LTLEIGGCIIVANTTVAYATIIEGEKMQRFMKKLNNISRSQSTYRLARLEDADLCASHHTFLFAVNRHPGKSQEYLATELCLNKSTVARTLNTLEARGYIERVVNPENKREILVYPTAKTAEVLPRISAIAKEWSESISKGITEDELEVFFSVLSRLEAHAKEIVKGLAE